MMKQGSLRLSQMVITLMLGMMFNYQVLAKSLPAGVVIGDDTGLYATSEGDYFVDLPNVLPGEEYEKVLTIRSLDIEKPFELGLLVEPLSQTGAIDFSEYLRMTLILGDKILYEGPLLGDGSFDWKVDPLVIGTCRYGEDQILKAHFTVSNNLSTEDFAEESELQYKWTFIGTKKPEGTEESKDKPIIPKDKNGLLPKTGEEIKNAMYKVLVGCLLILIVLLLWKKRKEK